MKHLSLKKRKRRLLIISTLWASLLLFLSVAPGKSFVLVPFDIWMTFAHAIAYGVLAFFLCLYLRFKRSVGPFKMMGKNALIFAFVTASLWGGITELLQFMTPDRITDWWDLAADMAGAFVSLWVFIWYEKLRHPFFSSLFRKT